MNRKNDKGFFSAFLRIFLVAGVLYLFLWAVGIAGQNSKLLILIGVAVALWFIIKVVLRANNR